MKRVYAIIILVSLFALLYQLSPYIGFSEKAIFSMFLLSPILMIYMVYAILKSGQPSEYTFDERFYDDLDPND